jgi:ribosomal protein S18 acetylase RimI-like enzyme
MASSISMDVVFRPATDTDAEQVASVLLASRKAFVAFAPLAHADDDVRAWVANILIPGGGVSVAVAGSSHEGVVGMMAVSQQDGLGWIDQLYLHPSVVGRGLGRRFIDLAMESIGSPIRLYTFQENAGARRFYERHGFRAIAFSDGSNNEEHCPDVLYEWAAPAQRPRRSANSRLWSLAPETGAESSGGTPQISGEEN